MTTRNANKATDNQTPSDVVHTTETQRAANDRPTDPTAAAAPTGDDVNQTASDQEPATKLFAVVSYLGGDRQQVEMVAAESADGLEQRTMHAYGLADDQVHVYELRTV